MKKNYVLATCLFLIAPLLHGQVAADEIKKTPYIEVTGSAEMEIVPDEIYIQVTLQERYNGKEKITMEKQDALFITGMQSLNIDSKDISLADAQSDFSSYKWKKEDALARKSYVVLVHDAALVSKVYAKLVEIDAEDAYILKTSHSKIEEYRKQIKINAMIATKDKAGYLLSSIGEEVGSPILIQERETYDSPYTISQRSLASNVAFEAYNLNASDIGFKKIKLRYEIFAQFEIK
ncbi:MAG TPA: SIMPL domain-containing protein [Chitinophagales bacterium]|nr:SIMPL domain-containing protein [Chitinophagales bacterium]HRG26362.1 SIMPL domain-containing protein [Chitinophagales bacterium]HRG85363.1 SIMPL domain-containing protein [Chitinophagales bacterium]HRH52464.1 SIMPL domain-containing protein [Chitinophagales bacterium]